MKYAKALADVVLFDNEDIIQKSNCPGHSLNFGNGNGTGGEGGTGAGNDNGSGEGCPYFNSNP